jgi:hypothetical protein
MNVFVLVILFYLLYRFIDGFLIPLLRASRQMRRQFHDINQHPPNGGQPGNPSNPGTGTKTKAQAGSTPKSTSAKVGEYIDFEEVK